MSFKKDLEVGKFAEKHVCDFFSKNNIKCKVDCGKYNLWDLEVDLNGKILTCEVKYDKMASSTGNLAVEFYNPKLGRPSGLFATEAKLWIFVLDDPLSIWTCGTIVLKNYFEKAKFVRIHTHAGDKNASIKLFEKEKILDDLFTQIDILNEEEVKKLMGNYL